MTHRERLLKVLHGEMPDCVPVSPDISNMIPAKLTGKPFWDVFFYQDPPLWKAYIDAVKYFDSDGGFEIYGLGNTFEDEPDWESRIVKKNEDGSFVTWDYCEQTGQWARYVRVHTVGNPPSAMVKPETVGLPSVPTEWEKPEGIVGWPKGMELWKLAKKEMGDHGILPMHVGMSTSLINNIEDVYAYHDNPRPFFEEAEKMRETVKRRLGVIRGLDEKPDFIYVGASGSLIFQTPAIFRDLILPVLKDVCEIAVDMDLPTHLHSCGPEKELIEIVSRETEVTIIEPLEIAPMGDCDLAELKKKYGDKIVLKGNLHTTNVMLHGAVDDVIKASKKAIDDAGANGGFVLSTGDQCGRDTPEENIRAMVETARTYGRYL